MTTIELEASKAELVREILNIENSETIGKLRKYLSKLRSNKEEASSMYCEDKRFMWGSGEMVDLPCEEIE